jgi:hypothetical protein
VGNRPNDPVAELVSAPIRAKKAFRRIRGTASKGHINGTAARPDVASFIAARTAALAVPDTAEDPGTNGGAGPPPPRGAAAHPEPAVVELPPQPETRPRIVEDPAILGLTRVSRSRLGSRLFTWFFVFVYAVILIQLIVSLLQT